MKYFIRTYGCQMNERDSEALGAALENAGFLRGCEEDADLLLFNTCSVREAAERKAKGKIGYIRKLKQKNPDLIIGVTGCMAQRLGDELLKELPHLDCGSCGASNCHALAEDIIKGDAKETDCLIKLRENYNN